MYYDTITATVSMTPEFQLGREMNGLIADFNVWRRALSDEEVSDFVRNCGSISKKDIWLDWSIQMFEGLSINGSVKMLNLTRGEVCNGEKSSRVISIDQPFTFKEAKHICRKLGGEIAVPDQVVTHYTANPLKTLDFYLKYYISYYWHNSINNEETLKKFPWCKGLSRNDVTF